MNNPGNNPKNPDISLTLARFVLAVEWATYVRRLRAAVKILVPLWYLFRNIFRGWPWGDKTFSLPAKPRALPIHPLAPIAKVLTKFLPDSLAPVVAWGIFEKLRERLIRTKGGAFKNKRFEDLLKWYWRDKTLPPIHSPIFWRKFTELLWKGFKDKLAPAEWEEMKLYLHRLVRLSGQGLVTSTIIALFVKWLKGGRKTSFPKLPSLIDLLVAADQEKDMHRRRAYNLLVRKHPRSLRKGHRFGDYVIRGILEKLENNFRSAVKESIRKNEPMDFNTMLKNAETFLYYMRLVVTTTMFPPRMLLIMRTKAKLDQAERLNMAETIATEFAVMSHDFAKAALEKGVEAANKLLDPRLRWLLKAVKMFAQVVLNKPQWLKKFEGFVYPPDLDPNKP